MAHWYDVSMPIYEGMVTWPGDPPFRVKPDRRISQGDSCNTSCLTLHTHTGTHIDAPWHYLEKGKHIDEVDPNTFFGLAQIIEIKDTPVIRSKHIPDKILPRVLFKTDNSTIPLKDAFRQSYVALDADAAAKLVELGTKLVGIDYLSIGPYKQEGRATHHILLEHDVVIVEGLQLTEIPAGVWEFVVLPLRLCNLDGSPCRAFIRMEER